MLFQNLKSFLKNFHNQLLLILIVGFVLRSINLTIGFPILYVSGDEANYHLSALNMIANKTIFTLGNYGPLGAYLQIPFLLISFITFFLTGKVISFKELELLLVTHEGYFLFVPRIISALFGTLTILTTYHLSKELFSKKEIALVSSLFCSLSLNLVFISHQARPWAPTIFFAMVATYFAVIATKRTDKFLQHIILSAIFSAISFGFHQFGGLIIILVILIVMTSNLSFKKYFKKFTLSFFLFIVLITVFNYLSLGSKFFSILNPNNTSDDIQLLNPGIITNFSLSYIFNFLSKLFLSDFVIIFLFLIFLLSKEFRLKAYIPFKIFILINLLLSLFIFPPFIRYFLIAFSFFPVFAAPVFYNLISNIKYKTVVFILVIILSSLNPLYFNFLIAQKGTFSQMREWVDKNIPQEAIIIATTHRNMGYVPTATATSKIRERKPGYYLRAANLIDDKFVPNVRFIVYANELSDKGMSEADYTKKALKYYDADIIVDTYSSSAERLLNSNNKLNIELIKHFSPTGNTIYDESIPEAFSDTSFLFPLFKLQKPGPYFDILKVKY